jgi:hypothetical protein
MTYLARLWLPIVVSGVVVFILSAASHMILPWRKKEWARLDGQDRLQAALGGAAPGSYAFPAAPDRKENMGKEWLERWAKGPSGWLTVAPAGPVRMGRNLALSFLAFVGVSFLTAYVASLSLGPATPALAVVRLFSTVGVLAYAVGPIFNSIWYHRPWRAYASDLLDAFIFGFAMAGVFAALWPR